MIWHTSLYNSSITSRFSTHYRFYFQFVLVFLHQTYYKIIMKLNHNQQFCCNNSNIADEMNSTAYLVPHRNFLASLYFTTHEYFFIFCLLYLFILMMTLFLILLVEVSVIGKMQGNHKMIFNEKYKPAKQQLQIT